MKKHHRKTAARPRVLTGLEIAMMDDVLKRVIVGCLPNRRLLTFIIHHGRKLDPVFE
jgi:hypothetical protein